MSKCYFLGAGASAADGVPVTWQLNFGIASYLEQEGKLSALRNLYQIGFAVDDASIRKDSSAWERFFVRDKAKKLSSALPGVIEVLSVLDVCVTENRGLGPAPRRSNNSTPNLTNRLLREAREELVLAMRLTVIRAVRTINKTAHNTRALLASMKPPDAIVTTNWDYLIEKELSKAQRNKDGGWLKNRNMMFGCINERITDWRGVDVKGEAPHRIPILKLHGGVNWYLCERCHNLYINVEYVPKKPHALVEDNGGCHCDAGLTGLIIAPSYLKDYNNPHLKSVWVNAQKRLEAASDWIFIGYSFPADDFHIRALLLRALAIRRGKNVSTWLTVVTDGTPGNQRAMDLHNRFREFFRVEDVALVTGGMENFLSSGLIHRQRKVASAR